MYYKNKPPHLIEGVIILANIFLDMLQRKGSSEISLLSLIWDVLTYSNNKTKNDEVFQETIEYEKGFAKYYQENLKPKILDDKKKFVRNIEIFNKNNQLCTSFISNGAFLDYKIREIIEIPANELHTFKKLIIEEN